MPQHATSTSFQPGHKRSPESIAAQKAAIAKLVAAGRWSSQLPEVAAKLRQPNALKAHYGPKNNKWKPVGTKVLVGKSHYIRIKVAEPDVWEYEHRIVAEAKTGRPIRKGEEVHHINGDKLDNRAENLVVMTPSQHRRLPKSQNGHPPCGVCGYRHPPHS